MPGSQERGDAHVHPTQDDPVAGRLSEALGGPVGSRAGRHPWWTPVRVLLAITAITFALGMLQKAPCYENTWTDGTTRYTHMCYSDLPYLYTGRGLAELAWPYSTDEDVRDRYPQVMEYPVGISYWAWGTAVAAQWLAGATGDVPDLDARSALSVDQLFGDLDVQREIRGYVIVNAAGFALLTLLAVWLLAGVSPGRPWDAVFMAASPALLLTALVNWDLVAVVLVAGALWAHARGRPVLTGLMIGLGTATKLYPLFLLGAVLVLALRRDRRPGPRGTIDPAAVPRRDLAGFGLTTLAAVAAWVVAQVPALLGGTGPWTVFWSFNDDRGADLGSLWLVAQQASGTTIDIGLINDVSLVFFAAWCVGVLVLGLVAPEPPRLAQLGFLLVAGFLLVNKVYSPQYVLWLLPLAALARPRWRDQVVWQGTEVLYFAFVWWYLGGFLAPAGGGDAGFYWLAIVLRVLGEVYLVSLVVRDVLSPRHDPVRGPVAGRLAAPRLRSRLPVRA
ncbi:glycosyltransferase family 87 protein [Nocardioides bruguierae]|uniref:Glycosyltransferase 87 family protein n=1 Tax=Nocardioides bruguierae TaxID=2945102 RepID=A0A9X2D8F1_9ACTN|nr:glycosyltransferase 87 family protein [Nocardioides bruguierae]MCM0620959.1 glycosyltransferase 87 family protein [Nocardioides bruguierae]